MVNHTPPRPDTDQQSNVVMAVHVRTLFFFFQAEDGIRDYKVTGVQTCALPIFPFFPMGWAPALGTVAAPATVPSAGAQPIGKNGSAQAVQPANIAARSAGTSLDRKSVV